MLNAPGAGATQQREACVTDKPDVQTSWAMYRYGSVELCTEELDGRVTYFARIMQGRSPGDPSGWNVDAWTKQGSNVYVLAADDGHYDPVDHWYVFDASARATAERLDDLADGPLVRMLTRAARLADLSRLPWRPLARLSSPLPENRSDELDDDEFNRLADEIAQCDPRVQPGMLYQRALRLRESERRGAGSFLALVWS